MKYYDITKERKKVFTITTDGEHVFWFKNISAKFTFNIMHPKARVYIYGIYDASATEKYTLSTTQHHSTVDAESHVLIKGVFRDNAQFVYDGIIHVDSGAGNTHATLINRNLVLGSNVSITTVPQLEVIPSDVSCTHSATVATIDTAQLHYLMSRGLIKSAAQKIIATGFLDEIAQKIDKHNL